MKAKTMLFVQSFVILVLVFASCLQGGCSGSQMTPQTEKALVDLGEGVACSVAKQATNDNPWVDLACTTGETATNIVMKSTAPEAGAPSPTRKSFTLRIHKSALPVDAGL